MLTGGPCPFFVRVKELNPHNAEPADNQQMEMEFSDGSRSSSIGGSDFQDDVSDDGSFVFLTNSEKADLCRRRETSPPVMNKQTGC